MNAWTTERLSAHEIVGCRFGGGAEDSSDDLSHYAQCTELRRAVGEASLSFGLGLLAADWGLCTEPLQPQRLPLASVAFHEGRALRLIGADLYRFVHDVSARFAVV